MNIIDALQIVFIVLKLTRMVNWSWWIVLMPFWWTLVYVLLGGGKHD